MLCSCSSKHDSIVLEKDYASIITRDSIEIRIDSSQIKTYGLFSAGITEGGEHIFSGYNDYNHTLQLFDLSTRKLYKTIELKKDGPSEISDVSGIYFHNLDSIFFYNKNKIEISILNTNSLNVEHVNFLDALTPGKEAWPINDHNFRLFFHRNSASILFKNHYRDSYAEDLSLVGVYRLADDAYHYVDFFHTEPIDHKNQFGQLNNVCISSPSNRDKVYINNLYSNITYELDLNDLIGATVIEDSSVNSTSKLSNFVNGQSPDRHFVENDVYTELLPLENGYFLRVVWASATYDDSISNPFLDKQFVLHLYDKDFNRLYSEFLHNEGILAYGWFVLGNSIYFQINHPAYLHSKESVLKFNKFTFNID